MGLQFLHPAALWGLIALALPIVAHMTGAKEVARVDFPSLRFLRSSSLKLRRRRRLESLLLLLLRSLLVLLLVLLFARPQLSWRAEAPGGAEPSQPTILLLDASASMSGPGDGGTLFEEARGLGVELLESLEEGVPAGLLEFDGRARVVAPGMTTEHSMLASELGSLELGDGATDLAQALRAARDLALDAGLETANIFVLSDGSATKLPAPGGEQWPEGLRVHYHALGDPSARSNPHVSGVSVAASELQGGGMEITAEVRPAGQAVSRAELRLEIGGQVQAIRDAEFPTKPSEPVLQKFSLAVPVEGAHAAVLRRVADDLPADDAYPFVLAGEESLDVLLISGDGGGSQRAGETYYLERALLPRDGGESRVRPKVVQAEGLRGLGAVQGGVFVLANVANPGSLAPELVERVRAGAGLLISVGGNVDPDRYNEVLGELLPAPFTELKTRGKGTFETASMGFAVPPMDLDEFRVFRSGGLKAFSRVKFGKALGTAPRLADESRVLLRYADGLPALLERRVGAGRVLVFTSSLDDDWTDLPLRSLYVPLVHQLVRSLSGDLLFESGQDLEVGESLDLPLPGLGGERAAWVEGPGGLRWTLDAARADGDGRVNFGPLEQAGHYQLFWDDRAGGEPRLKGVFSVRVPEVESSLRPASPEDLLARVSGLVYHRRGEDLSASSDASAEVVRRAGLTPWILILLLLVFLAEGLLLSGTGRLAR